MLSEYEKYLKTVAQGQKDTSKAQLDEKQRQLDLAAQQNEKDAHSQISQAKASGTIGSEQRRIIDNMTGYGGSGAAVQNQINAALSTDSATGKINEALANARNNITNQRTTNLAGYNSELLSADNQVKASLEKAKYEQLVAAAQAEQERKDAERNAAIKAQQDSIAASKQAEKDRVSTENQAVKDRQNLIDNIVDRAIKFNTKNGELDIEGAKSYIDNYVSSNGLDDNIKNAAYVDIGSSPSISPVSYQTSAAAQPKASNNVSRSLSSAANFARAGNINGANNILADLLEAGLIAPVQVKLEQAKWKLR